MIENKLGIYVHIPFCYSKCPYCDFYSVGAGKARKRISGGNAALVGSETDSECTGLQEKSFVNTEAPAEYRTGSEHKDLQGEYIEAVKKEIKDFFERNAGKYEVDTVYFGGGTPNSLRTEELREILGCAIENAGIECGRIGSKATEGSIKSYDNSASVKSQSHSKASPEITIEVNPKSAKFGEPTDFKALREMGFNRISIGCQSFDDDILKSLGRIHSAGDNRETVRLAKEAGFDNISLDLMFGIPGQTEEIWEETVRQAIEMDCQHISMYSLEFMEGTRFTRMLEEGKMQETPEEADRMMYHKAIDMLSAAGYRQYEISNFAKPGFESRHNSKYWMLEEYAGFGPSAHSYIANRRYSNPADLELYIKNPLSKVMYGENTVFDDMSEFVFTGLRMADGVDTDKFSEKFGMDIWAAFESAREEFERFAADGYAEITDNRIRLTLKGFDISNRIMCLFV